MGHRASSKSLDLIQRVKLASERKDHNLEKNIITVAFTRKRYL